MMKYKLHFSGYKKIVIYMKNIYQDTSYFVKQYLQSQNLTLRFEFFFYKYCDNFDKYYSKTP